MVAQYQESQDGGANQGVGVHQAGGDQGSSGGWGGGVTYGWGKEGRHDP